MKKTLFLLTFCSFANGGILPDYDYNCDAMDASPCEVEHVLMENVNLYAQVPKIIHRIWLGDKSKLSLENRTRWEKYASIFNYKYTLWTEDDDQLVQSFMQEKNFALYLRLRQDQNWWGAADILRFEIIKNYGGIYIDCDFSPPQYKNAYIDFFKIFPKRGLSLITEHYGRDIKSYAALFAANGILIAPPNHPIICSQVNQVFKNAMSWIQKKGHFDAPYCTGPFLLNKILTGPFTIVPGIYLTQFKMY